MAVLLIVGRAGQHLPEAPAAAGRVRGQRMATRKDSVPEWDDEIVSEGFDHAVAEEAGGDNEEREETGV